MKGFALQWCCLFKASVMTSTELSHAPSRTGKTAVKAIVLGGILAGVLDLAFALTYYAIKGGKLLKVLQSIAAGVQGKAAYQGGAGAAALGVALHFVIALGAAVFFWAAGRAVPLLVRRPWISGPLFGAGVYYFMNLVVLPLSALQTKGYPLIWEPWMLAAHVFFVGLPIALVARRCSR
jgi:hypothetical protein